MASHNTAVRVKTNANKDDGAYKKLSDVRKCRQATSYHNTQSKNAE